jgi:hypothetical protein
VDGAGGAGARRRQLERAVDEPGRVSVHNNDLN